MPVLARRDGAKGVTRVKEMLGARTAEVDLQWRRTYRRAWRVITDTPYVGALEVRTAIPVSLGNHYVFNDINGAQLEYDTLSFATKIAAQLDPNADDDCQWVVTVDYTPYDPTQFPENPLDWPIKVSFGGAKFERAIDETPDDGSGNTEPILNSAGDYFDPPVTVDDNRPTLKITRNEQYFDPILALDWKDVVNADQWGPFPPGTAKLALPTGELEFNPNCGFYYVITYEFEINPDGWTKRVLDQGLKELDPATGKKKVMLDEDGKEITSPALLDGNGQELAADAAPVYMEYEIYRTGTFADLNLPLEGIPGLPPAPPRGLPG